MGGKSSASQTTAQTQNSTTAPWAAAQPALSGILGQLQGQIGNSGITPGMDSALNQLSSNAQQGNPYASQIGDYANNLFSGYGGQVQGGLSTLQNQLTPYANGSMIGNNPGLQAQLDTLRSDISNQINGQFAGAGRDLSGMNQQALGRGISQGLAPVIASQYNQDVANQFNAANALYGANNSTTGLLAGLGGQGVQASQDALAAKNYAPQQQLAIEQMRQQIPAQNLGLLAQIGVPIAGLGSQSSGSSTGYGNTQQQMSGAQQFATIMSGIGQLGRFMPGGGGK